MTDWVPLREYLRADFERQVDDIILHEPDPDWRAYFARRREHIVEELTDKAELVTLRRMFAERGQDDSEVVPLTPALRRVRVNGRGH